MPFSLSNLLPDSALNEYLAKNWKMLKNEMNTSCSKELETEVVQIVLKRSLSLSDDDNTGSEIMEDGRQKLWNKALTWAMLFPGVCYQGY